MARKKPAEEHENLERWLVSYADFMTLLFATFVVLYALAQSDVDAFKNIEDALRKAFSQGIFDNQTSILSGENSILDGQNGATNPLMLEYVSQKYEETSYKEIKDSINSLRQKGLTADINEKGLIIRLNDQAIKFEQGSAQIDKESFEILDKVANIIKQKFSIHYIEVEGHSDSDGIKTAKYPSNWELSSARASSVIRYLIFHHNFNAKLFSAVGLADTVPLVKNTSEINKEKNRRVEIVILKNKYKNLSQKDMQKIMEEVKIEQKSARTKKTEETSEAVEKLIGNDKELLKNVIDIKEQYKNENERINSLNKENYVHDGTKPSFME